MPKKKVMKNWLWWTIGGVAAVGLGAGIYFWRRNKKMQRMINTPFGASPNSGNNSSGNTNRPAQLSTPFSSKAEGDAFRAWINDNYPDYARQIDLDRSGSHTNSYILRAWADYGQAYLNRNQNATPAPAVTSAGAGSAWSLIQSQMLSSAIWGANSTLNNVGAQSLKFAINVDGFRDVYVTFDKNGNFKLEKFAGPEFRGIWSFNQGVFSLRMNDNSFNASDNEIGEMVKQVMKLKYPNEMKFFSFDGNQSKSLNLQKMLTAQKSKHVDLMDSVL